MIPLAWPMYFQRMDAARNSLSTIVTCVALLTTVPFLALHAQSNLDATTYDSLASGRLLGKPTIVRLCGPTASDTSGIVFGAVRDVESGRPLASVAVAASWTEVTPTAKGVRLAIAHRQATSNAEGLYLLCGVPMAVRANVAAEYSARTVGPVGAEFGVTPFSRVDFTVGARASLTGGVSGVARIPGGAPAVGAELRIAGLPEQIRADSLGRFTFARVPSGTRELQLRRLGAALTRVTVEVPAGRVAMIEATLVESGQLLPSAVVLGMRDARDRLGFDERRQQGRGFFLTTDQISKMNAWDVGDLGYRASWVSATFIGGKRVLTFPTHKLTYGLGARLEDVSTRVKGCSPAVFLNGEVVLGTPFMSAFEVVTETLRPEEVFGMEMYRPDGYAPPQFRAFGGCGAVVFWTK